MPNILKSKNVLIVPLTLFIKYNEKNAAEKFALLFKNSQQFNEKSLQKILNSPLVTDFKLGKRNKAEFISKLAILLRLPTYTMTEVEDAWNSLIELDTDFNAAFDALIKLTYQGKSIYFIGNTNELHAKKILDLFSSFPFTTLSFLENLPDPMSTLPFSISRVTDTHLSNHNLVGSVYFCLSHAYKILLEQPSFTSFFSLRQTRGLLTQVTQYLNDTGKTKDDILLVNPYQEQSSIIKTLALETISKENFYSNLLEIRGASAMLTQSVRVNVHATPFLAVAEELEFCEESKIHLSASP